MKLTKQQLIKVIKEELDTILAERDIPLYSGPEGEGGVYDVEDGGYSYLEPAGMSMEEDPRPETRNPMYPGAGPRRGGIPDVVRKAAHETNWLQDLLGKDSSFRLREPESDYGLEEAIERDLTAVVARLSKARSTLSENEGPSDEQIAKWKSTAHGAVVPKKKESTPPKKEGPSDEQIEKWKSIPAGVVVPPKKERAKSPIKKQLRRAEPPKEKASTIKGRADDAFADLDALEEIKASFKKFL